MAGALFGLFMAGPFACAIAVPAQETPAEAQAAGHRRYDPPSVERMHGGKTGSFTWRADDAIMNESRRLKKNIEWNTGTGRWKEWKICRPVGLRDRRSRAGDAAEAKLLGIDDMMPPSVERKHGGKTGSFT